MDETSTRQSLGYFDLPIEIRLQILEFTGLNPATASLAPTSGYASNPSRRYLATPEELPECNPLAVHRTSAFGYAPIWRGRLAIPEDWRKETNSLCLFCARTTSRDSYCLQRRFGPRHAEWKLGKFYASDSRRSVRRWTRTCRCRSIPFSLFFVNKQMRAEAEYTLLKFNGLEFFPVMALDFCQYLSSPTVDKLRMLRDLRFTFSRQQLYLENWNDRGRNDWRLLLNWIRRNEDLRNLRLVVDAESHWQYLDCLNPYEESGFEDMPAYIGFYKMLCEIALELVIIHEKLQHLELKLPYLRHLEDPLEQEVMGSKYDGRQNDGSWPTLERRLPVCSRLPPWHDIAWKKLASRYRELAWSLSH